MSKIEWTDLTENPLKRVDGGNYCEKISPGCANCYASALNAKGTRFGGNGQPYGGKNQDRPEMTLNTEMLAAWARARRPKKRFVCSMTDMFGEWVSGDHIMRLLGAMSRAPKQTYQILTKRPEIARCMIDQWCRVMAADTLPPNIWLGVSAEDQQRLDERLYWLTRTTQARVEFLSLEPLLGPIMYDNKPIDWIDWIDWVIIGGESGPNARPMNLDWARDILDQCKAANVPVFVKQLGTAWAKEAGADHRKGGNWEEWPPEFWVRMWPGDSWADMPGGYDPNPGP